MMVLATNSMHLTTPATSVCRCTAASPSKMTNLDTSQCCSLAWRRYLLYSFMLKLVIGSKRAMRSLTSNLAGLTLSLCFKPVRWCRFSGHQTRDILCAKFYGMPVQGRETRQGRCHQLGSLLLKSSSVHRIEVVCRRRRRRLEW